MQVDLSLPSVSVQESNVEPLPCDYAENVVWQVARKGVGV